MFEEKMSETIEAGAPSIKYNRGDIRMGQGQGDQRSMQIAAEIWEQMEPQQKVQFGNFEKFYQSGIWRQILQQLQADQQQEGIASQMPREMMEEQVSMSERVPAMFGGDMEKLSMRETIDTPTGIETIKETDTMEMAGGGERGWKAQMLAEDLAEEKYGKEFYDLTQEQQFEIYTMALDMIDTRGMASGGRVAAQEGGLMDLGGMEKDYRNEGGFVPIGGQERADDVPARLSKNEFVFTADAVRSAGGGDIDKGAEVMENVMEHLEQGGQISEESQGLEGARNMFATAQRLEGVM